MTSRPEIITAGRGYAQTSQQLEALATLDQTDSEPASFIEMLSERSRLVSGCLFILSAFEEHQQTLLSAVESKGVQTLVFIITKESDDRFRDDFHVLHPGNIEQELAAL